MLARLSRTSRLISAGLRASSIFVINYDIKYKQNDSHTLYNHQYHEYFTGPLAAAAGITASAFGTYWTLRAHFNPIKSRPFDEIMKNNMIGQYIDGDAIDIGQLPPLNPLNTNLESEIREMRNDTIKKIRQRFQFQFLTGNLYLRPILFDNNQYTNIDTMKLFNEYGICHAFWILNAGPVDYILDYVQEGIRFEMVENANQTIKDNSNIYISCFPAPVSLNISSYALLDWIESETKLNKKYDLNSNHCLNFVDRFGQNFKPEIFHDDQRISQFNKGIKEKTNEELLNWTKSVIDSSRK